MRPRGRPIKPRIIRQEPRISQFSPRGKPGRPDEVCLWSDEFECLRLTDFLGKSQKEASGLMNISQQTVSRLLKRGRNKLADAVINGKIIRIQSHR